MNQSIWADLHRDYKDQEWVDMPSLFAERAAQYFPAHARVLELGAGQGQDSRFFAEQGHDVLGVDIEDSALKLAKSKAPADLKKRLRFQKLDMREKLPFDDESFDVVYAHLSLHYFDHGTTMRILGEILRVLKPGGVLAFLVNSVHDPQYKTGKQLEPDFFQFGKSFKRYFSETATRRFVRIFETILLDDHGETYKDQAKGVHGLVRFIGKKPLRDRGMVIPFCGAIIERKASDGRTELLLQTRWKPNNDPVYSGTLEFPAGAIDDVPFEDVHATLAHEIKEECGLTLKSIKNDQRTDILTTGKDDAVIGFRPFCCTQQLKNGRPWIGFIFVCEVEPGKPKAQHDESRDIQWLPAAEVKRLVTTSPEKFFALELPAWRYYFDERI